MNMVKRTLQMQLNYRPNEIKSILDYPGGPNLIIWAPAGGRWRDEADRKSERLKAFEGRGHMMRSAGSLKELKKALAANQQRTGTLALQPQGTEFCHQPEWAWEGVLPQSLQVRAQAGQHLDFTLCNPNVRTSQIRRDFWLTELWANECVLF